MAWCGEEILHMYISARLYVCMCSIVFEVHNEMLIV